MTDISSGEMSVSEPSGHTDAMLRTRMERAEQERDAYAARAASADETLAWVERTLGLPVYNPVVGAYGEGCVETLRTVRNLLTGKMHPSTRAALEAADEARRVE